MASRDDMETGGKRGGFIAVAHPDELAVADFVGGKEGGGFIDANFHAAVLLFMANADLAAEAVDEELEAVANAEDGDAVGLSPLEEAVGEGGGIRGVDGVGAAGEDDDGGVEFGDGVEGRGAGNAEGEHGETADAASDEVSVLGTEV